MKALIPAELRLRALRVALSLIAACGIASAPLTAAQKPAPSIGGSLTPLPGGSVLVLGSGSDQPSHAAALLDQKSGQARQLTGGLINARVNHSATLLPDGHVLIFGGFGPDGLPVRQAEMFDPATSTFQAAGDLGLLPRAGHAAIMVTDGRVLFTGGVDDRHAPLATTELWDPRTGRISAVVAGFDRNGHEAALLTDGSVLLYGGKTASGESPASAVIFDPGTQSVASLDAAQANALLASRSRQPLFIAATVPAAEEQHFAPDGMIAVRFSTPTDMASISDSSIVLFGPGGVVPARVTPSQDGMLAFVSPLQPLFPGSRYTVFADGAATASGQRMALQAFGFDTIRLGAASAVTQDDSPSRPDARRQDRRDESSEQSETAASAPGGAELAGGDEANEVFIPNARHRGGKWRTGRPLPELVRELRDHEGPYAETVKLRRARFLKAKRTDEVKGTGVAGYVLRLNDRPLQNATLSIGAAAARTDDRGRFVLFGVGPGRQELVVNGRTAGGPGREFAQVVIGVDVKDGAVTNLPYAVYLPRVRARDWVTLDAPTQAERVLTHPDVPGLEVRIPRGAVLRDRDGSILTRIAFVPVPMDRTPYPTPGNFPSYFLLHPGGATVHGLAPGVSPGIRIVYPNMNDDAPGTPQQLWFYDAREGWLPYGKARVTADRKQIVPDPGVGLHQAMGFSILSLGDAAPPPADADPEGSCEAKEGDPVDCFTGLFTHARTDVSLPDVFPIGVTRTYRPRDTVSRAFGIGASHNYALYLHGTLDNPVVVLPNGAKIRFDRLGPTTWMHTATPSRFQNAMLEQLPDNSELGFGPHLQFRLTLKDKTLIYFSAIAPNELLSIKDRNGNQLMFSSAGGLLNRVTSPGGRYVDFAYDASRRITEIRDIANRVWTYEYNAGGLLSKATYPDLTFEEYTYDALNRMESVKDRRGNIMVTNVYDANGRVQQQTLADNGVYQFAYTVDVNGKVTQTDVTDPRGKVRHVAFNADGYVTASTYAVGTAEEQTYTYERQAATNLLLSAIDPLGRKTTYTYDSRNNVASVTRMADTAEAVSESYTYDPVFNGIASRTNGLNKTTSFVYDPKGNLAQVTDPLSHQISFAYNSVGQPTSATNGVNQTTQFAYDLNDLVRITDPLGRVTERVVDGLGRVEIQTDPLGHRTRYEYDALNRVKKITDALDKITEFSYDGNGNLISVRDPNNGVHQFGYDGRNRPASYTDPLNKTELYVHDGMSNLVSFTDRKLQITSYAYDSRNRRTLASFADTSTVSYVYDAAGRLTQAIDSSTGAVTRVHDNLDRMTSETTPAGAVSYAYDSAGRRTSMTVVDQAQTTYAYDDADRLTSVTRGSAVVQIGYDNANRRTSLTLPNGIVATYGYDDGSQLTSIAYALGSTSIGDLNYTYDLAGRRTKMTGSLARTQIPAAMPLATYDAANRLTNWNGTPITYDDQGNMLSDGSRTFTWDAQNRLSAISGSINASFMYDALGRRLAKTVAGATTQFVYDGLNPVQERSAGSAVANLLTGLAIDEFFRRTDANGNRDFITDALGSTLGLADSAGAMQTTYAYEPYGGTSALGQASTTSMQYTGRENDGTGLFYYRARFYHPELQRFVSEDPMGLTAGLNVYAYVRGDPVRAVDPLGFWEWNFNAGGHIWAFPAPGAGGGSFSSTWKPGGGLDDATYQGFHPEFVWGSLADVGVTAGISGLTCSTEKPWTISINAPFMGKYGGVQFNFNGWSFDGFTLGLGVGVSLPVTLTEQVNTKTK